MIKYIHRGIDQPKFIGDEVLWYVSNDTELKRKTVWGSPNVYDSVYLNLEIQNTEYAFGNAGLLGDVVFVKSKIINKSQNIIHQFVIADYTNFNLGVFGLDTTRYTYAGIDRNLGLVYSYLKSNTRWNNIIQNRLQEVIYYYRVRLRFQIIPRTVALLMGCGEKDIII